LVGTWCFARGKLQWLDPIADDLPLEAGPSEEWPYAEVKATGGLS
jgi:hypothetical protein